MKYDAVIIGGGAAGLFCAARAGKRGKRVLVIEHNAEVGRKILISGGGRCNFTNILTSAENFVSQNPHFCKSALSQYTADDFIGLVRKHKIDYYEKKLGQMFCRQSSREIVVMLMKECRDSQVEIRTGCSVTAVRKSDVFTIGTSQGDFETANLIVACGGLSFAKIGATDLGYRIARQFGLKIVPTRPSLVAMIFEGKGYRALAGISVDSVVSNEKAAFRENILFTHRGLSGPAILQISNYWHRGDSVLIDLLPGVDVTNPLNTAHGSRKDIENYLKQFLPQRFVTNFLPPALRNKKVGDLSKVERIEIGERLNNWHVTFRDTEGYDRAEVTLGGVSTEELSSTTMESKKLPGLYFIGEIVDVTGWLGGYNFQWAWSSAYATGSAI
jgi:predicted Rossmann fold flavoprotein